MLSLAQRVCARSVRVPMSFARHEMRREMCGIVAVIDHAQPPVEASVRELCGRMHMRGPDGQGYAAGSTSAFHWALAHQRLAIMDPGASGDQPFHATAAAATAAAGGSAPSASSTTSRGGATLTANGEIYNYKQLYAELGDPPTQSSSDCEVILHLYHDLMAAPGATAPGVARQLCERLDGMFAFVIVDEATGAYVAGRDPCGKKPLYMGVRHEKQAAAGASAVAAAEGSSNGSSGGSSPVVVARTFASELKCLAKEGFDEVIEIPGGHCFTPEGGITRYHSPAWQFDAGFTPDPAITAADVRAALEKACVKRMMSDVEYGLFLSGGVDSCVVGELMRPHIGHNGGAPRLPSFTVGQEGSPDIVAARAVASALGCYEHHERLFSTEEALSIIDRVVYQLETYVRSLARPARTFSSSAYSCTSTHPLTHFSFSCFHPRLYLFATQHTPGTSRSSSAAPSPTTSWRSSRRRTA
jgi:asparagine synthase (glutamine-hydrolysing)